MFAKRTLLAVLSAVALMGVTAPTQALAAEAEPATQVFSAGSSQVIVIHRALLAADLGTGFYEGTCLIKFLKNWTQYNCHGKLVSGTAPAHLENLSSEGVKIILTPSGNVSVEISR